MFVGAEPPKGFFDFVVVASVLSATSMGTRPGLPVAGDGYQAGVKAKCRHLRLFAEVYPLGYFAAVFDLNTKQTVARGDADNLDDAKKKAESLAAGYLRYWGAGELPAVEWNLNAQSRSAT
jgi:hypothetical protein